MTENTTSATIEPIQIRRAIFTIRGTTPLITNRFSERSKGAIRDKQAKMNVKGKEKRDIHAEYLGAIYYLEESTEDNPRYGFPSTGVKNAMIDAAYRYMGLTKVDIRGFVQMDIELCEIIAPEPKLREDVVRLAGASRAADLRYRPEFWPWQMNIPMSYRPNLISEKQIVEMLNHAGFSGGIGEWRPQTNGHFGRFELTSVGDN